MRLAKSVGSQELAAIPRQRTRTGCLTCRQRRKKCDETRPVCRGCIRNKLSCTWTSNNTQEASHVLPIAAESRSVRSTRLSTPGPREQKAPSSIDITTAVRALKLLDSQRSHACRVLGVETIPSTLSWPTRDLADRRLLQHYIECTSKRLLPLKRTGNPFIDHILPIACSDSTTLHVLLAISASHLSFRDASSSAAAQTHYIVCIRALKHKVARFIERPGEDAVALLACMLLLCLFESVNGDMEGRLSKHLHASTAPVSYLRRNKVLSQDSLPRILFEQFVYFSFIHRSLRFGDVRDQHADQTLRQLSDSIALDLTAHDIDGIAFGRTYQVYKILPEIRAFAEMVPKTFPRYADSDIELHFDLLESKVLQSEVVSQDHADEEDVAAGLLIQLGVLVYLHAARSGPGMPPEGIMTRVQLLISEFVTVDLQLNRNAPCRSLLLWPLIVVGSCALQQSHRAHIQCALLHSHHMMYATTSVLRHLRLLWNDKGFGESCFGPFGLEDVARRYDVDLSLG
jgi:hypothetical protein